MHSGRRIGLWTSYGKEYEARSLHHRLRGQIREPHEISIVGMLHLSFRFRVARFENPAISGTIHKTRNT